MHGAKEPAQIRNKKFLDMQEKIGISITKKAFSRFGRALGFKRSDKRAQAGLYSPIKTPDKYSEEVGIITYHFYLRIKYKVILEKVQRKIKDF